MPTWLPDTADGDTELERVFGLRPDLYQPFRAFYDVFWTERLLDPVTLELCRLRVAQLLGLRGEEHLRYEAATAAGLTEALVAALPSWPHAAEFTEAQRAALAFTEQFVIDPHGIDDGLRDRVIDAWTVAGLVALCEALALFEGFDRFRAVLGVDGPGAATVVAGPRSGTALP